MTAALMEVPKTVFERNWTDMNAAEQRAFFSKNGFLVIPDVFSPEQVMTMLDDIEQLDLENKKIDMCEAFCLAPSFADMVDSPKITSVVTNLIGSKIACIKGCYVAKKSKEENLMPHRTALHVDYGILEREGDYRASSALWVNVICYLTGMSLRHAPLAIIPGSHNYYHLAPESDMESLKDEAVTMMIKAGDAVVFLHNTIHAGGSNVSGRTQHILFCAYRPTWARPVGPVAKWPKEFVESSPPSRKRLIVDLSTGSLQSEIPPFIVKHTPTPLLKKAAEFLLTLSKAVKSDFLSSWGNRFWTTYRRKDQESRVID
jgi:hypothetical protein